MTELVRLPLGKGTRKARKAWFVVNESTFATIDPAGGFTLYKHDHVNLLETLPLPTALPNPRLVVSQDPWLVSMHYQDRVEHLSIYHVRKNDLIVMVSFF